MMRICSSELSWGQITRGGGDKSFFIVPSHCLLIVLILQPARGRLRRTLDWEASDIAHSFGFPATRRYTCNNQLHM